MIPRHTLGRHEGGGAYFANVLASNVTPATTRRKVGERVTHRVPKIQCHCGRCVLLSTWQRIYDGDGETCGRDRCVPS